MLLALGFVMAGCVNENGKVNNEIYNKSYKKNIFKFWFIIWLQCDDAII